MSHSFFVGRRRGSAGLWNRAQQVGVRAGLALALAALALACSGSPKRIGDQPSWRRPNEVRPYAEPERPNLGPVVFAPASPASAGYNDPPATPAPRAALGDAIVGELQRIAAGQGVTAPVADGRLFQAAADLATVVPEKGALPYSFVEFALQRQGIIEPSPHILVIWGPLDDPQPIMEQLAERLPALMADGPFARVGVGTAARGKSGEGVAILALQHSHVITEPLPRALPRGGRVELRGRILGAYREPAVFVTDDRGRVAEFPLSLERDRFTAGFECQGRVGRQQVELTAVDAQGSTVLANFPIWCNAEAPTSISADPSEDDLSPAATAEIAEARMVELVNRDRAAHGLGPLAIDLRVTEVARAHSREMWRTGEVAHVSPTTGAAVDRVKAAGIRTAVVLENVARAYGVVEAQDGLMNSPGHRANLLSTAATHLGIGIVFGDEVAGRREMFVTQVFTRVPPVIDRAKVGDELTRRIKAVRPITVDAELAELAGLHAAELAKGGGDRSKIKSAPVLERLAQRFRRVTTAVTTVADIAAFDATATVADASITHIGVGVAQGPHEVIGDGAIYVVVLVAQSR